MATKEAACSVLGREWSHNGTFSSHYEHGAGYAGYNEVYYYVYILKFTTPNFSGKCEKISFHLPCTMLTFETAVLRYALCASDENAESYHYTYGEVEDSTQLAAGTVTMTGLSTMTAEKEISIDTGALAANTDYYLYLWAAAKTAGTSGGCVTLGNSSGITAIISYNAGVVQVQTAEGVKSAAVDVFLNGVWHENCIPEEFLDGAWKTSG